MTFEDDPRMDEPIDREEYEKWEREQKAPTVFKVTDGDMNGWCVSFSDHFYIRWDDGKTKTCLELSQFNIRKI